MRIIRIIISIQKRTVRYHTVYVCVCNSVTDRQIREAVESGCESMAALRSELKIATCCGKCESCARQMLNECLAGATWDWDLLSGTT